MENICEWKNCNESGKFKAPLEKDNSKNYEWLCEEHIKFLLLSFSVGALNLPASLQLLHSQIFSIV